MRTSLLSCTGDLERILQELEQLASQTAVHRKKFEFSVNQFRRFLTILTPTATSTPLTPAQSDAYAKTVDCARDLHQLLSEHQLHNWAHVTLENPSSTVATSLCALADRFRVATAPLIPSQPSPFDPDSPQWLQLHILDLKGIETSFKQYLERASSDDTAAPLLVSRLSSLSAFLKETDQPLSPGLRVFSPIPISYQQWRLSHDDFESVREVGSGVSATVFYGFDKRNGQEIAIKKLKFKNLSGQKLQTFQREVAVLATAHHPSLLGFVGATDTPPFCIVTEWMACDTLYHELHKHHRMTPTQMTRAAIDIAKGFDYLHSIGIIHRDMKSLNVLLDADLHAKVSDFGFSRRAGDLMTGSVGTPHWMAPEMLTSTAGYDSKIDVYAYGVVLWEMVTGKVPYEGLEAPQIVAQVLMSDLRPEIPMSTPQGLRDLIELCWQRNPSARPTFSEIIDKFRTGVAFPGTDEAFIKKYLGEDVQKQPVSCSVLEAYDKDNVKMNWEEAAKEFDGADNKLVGRVCLKFLNTQHKRKAATVLRKLPPGSVDSGRLSELVENIPTGNEEYDEDLVMVACRNGAADAAAIFVVSTRHIVITLEIIAQTGIDRRLRAAVADRCVQCLTSGDKGLICAAYRCLIKIGEARRVTSNAVTLHLKMGVKEIRKCVFMAAAAMAMLGVSVPVDAVDAILEDCETDNVACTAGIAICYRMEAALQVVNRIAYGTAVGEDTALKMLLVAAEHVEVRPAVMVALNRITFASTDKDSVEALSTLRKIVGWN